MDELKPIEIGYGDEKTVFYLRMISVSEEDSINKRIRDLADIEGAEKYKRQYEVIRDILAEFSAKPPEVTGKKVKPFADHFAEMTPKNERILNGAFYLFKSQLEPEARFL